MIPLTVLSQEKPSLYLRIFVRYLEVKRYAIDKMKILFRITDLLGHSIHRE